MKGACPREPRAGQKRGGATLGTIETHRVNAGSTPAPLYDQPIPLRHSVAAEGAERHGETGGEERKCLLESASLSPKSLYLRDHLRGPLLFGVFALSSGSHGGDTRRPCASCVEEWAGSGTTNRVVGERGPGKADHNNRRHGKRARLAPLVGLIR